MERCSEHPTIVDKVGGLQVEVAKIGEAVSNMNKSLNQVTDELKTRKLTPMVTWVISIMSGIIGGLGMYILTNLSNKI